MMLITPPTLPPGPAPFRTALGPFSTSTRSMPSVIIELKKVGVTLARPVNRMSRVAYVEATDAEVSRPDDSRP